MPLPVPAYPAARPLDIRDRVLLHGHLRALQPTVSELTFANLFLFRQAHRYTVTSMSGSLVILGYGYDGQPYALPPLSGDHGVTARRLLDEGHALYGADGQFVEQHLAGRGYAVVTDRDNDDYLYLRSELAELPGKRFHKKKNRVNYFISRHGYTVEPFSGVHLAAALQLVDQWQQVHGDAGNRSQPAETAATCEGLELAEQLGLSGVVILTSGRVCAFALGEQLNDSTAVCHFERTDPFLEGAAQLVNREYSRFQPVELAFINREQDLGESGMREAKSSYHPVAMVRKFRVTLAGANPGEGDDFRLS